MVMARSLEHCRPRTWYCLAFRVDDNPGCREDTTPKHYTDFLLWVDTGVCLVVSGPDSYPGIEDGATLWRFEDEGKLSSWESSCSLGHYG